MGLMSLLVLDIFSRTSSNLASYDTPLICHGSGFYVQKFVDRRLGAGRSSLRSRENCSCGLSALEGQDRGAVPPPAKRLPYRGRLSFARRGQPSIGSPTLSLRAAAWRCKQQ
jgi:hypothetical protein